jgi:hypothetical protein
VSYSKNIIKRVLEKKNPLYDFEVIEKEETKPGFLSVEECGDIELMPGWEYTPPSFVKRNGHTYYVRCREKTGFRRVKGEVDKNFHLSVLSLTVIISVISSAISGIIVRLFLQKFFGFSFSP